MIPTVMQSSPIQNVTYTGTAGTSSAIPANEAGKTRTVRLVASSDCYYLATLAGTTATSSNSSFLLAGSIEYIRVYDQTIISVVQSTASGTLNITPMSDVTTP